MKKGFSQIVRMFRRIRMPWLWICICVCVMVVETLTQVEALTLTGSIIDATQNAIRGSVLRDYILSIVAYGLMTVIRVYVNSRMEQTLNTRMRDTLWNKIMHLSTRYYDSDSADELVTRVTVDASSAGSIVSVILSSFASIYSVVIIYSRLFRFNEQLATYALLVLPFTLIAGALYGKLTYTAGYRKNASLSVGIGYLAERVRSFRLIKSTAMEAQENSNGRSHYGRMFKAEMLSGVAISTFQIYLNFFNIIFILISFLAGGKLVQNEVITIGTLISFYSLSGAVTLQTSNLYSSIGGITETVGRLKKMSVILEAEEENQSGKPVPAEKRDITFNSVSFGYKADNLILKDISFKVPAGEITAIIGTNGAGKSTVAKLLNRMYEPASGTVNFGDEPISQFSLEKWRDSFSVVSQKNPLLIGTVRENITYGLDREVTDEELINAAKLANCYDFIMEKPKGFDEDVGLNGSNFSGGQQQCISIARAILRNAPCLLLDEATSNLDLKCEQMVSSALDRLCEGRTTVVIAHRSGAIRKASHIIVMRDGCIEADGTPDELFATNEYYRLFRQGKMDVSTSDNCSIDVN